MSTKNNYRCISIKCNDINDMYAKQGDVEHVIKAKGGKTDEGGVCLDGKWVRDIYFTATDKQFVAIRQAIKAKKFNIVKGQ